MVAALDADGLAKGNDRDDANGLAGFVDRDHVIAPLECGRIGLNAFAYSPEEVVNEARLVGARCLDAPRDGKAGSGTNGGVDAVAVEAASLPNGDRRAVSHEASGSENRSRSGPPWLRNLCPLAKAGMSEASIAKSTP